MNKLRIRILPVVLAMGFAVTLPTVVQAQEEAPFVASTSAVSVELGDFNTMRETRYLRGMQRRDTEQMVQRLATWLAKRAERVLPAGQRLEVVLVDVDLAGDYTPGRGPEMDHVRVVKDLYPPRIELSWRVEDADGTQTDEGEAVLTDMGFLSRTTVGSDALRYEKRMLDNWLRERFPK